MAAAPSAPTEMVALANAVAKLPYFEAFDAEAALAAYKEKVAPTAPGGLVTAAQLKEIWLGLGYDKVPEAAAPAEGEEKKDDDGAAAAAAAAAPAAASQHAEATFALIDTAKTGSLHVARVLGALQVCKAGYGEAALRFALKCAAADESGALKEGPLFTALGVAGSLPLSAAARNNLRRAWRTAAKFEPPQPEPSGEEGAPPPAPVVVAPADMAVMVDERVPRSIGRPADRPQTLPVTPLFPNPAASSQRWPRTRRSHLPTQGKLPFLSRSLPRRRRRNSLVLGLSNEMIV